ncbi:polyprenyl synthetase family protein [Blastopirellula marina]|nr:polyprenyl synthetase family protein [Blastopirellula marina]
MSQTANGVRRSLPADAQFLSSAYGGIAQEMAAVEAILTREMSSRFEAVNEVVSYGCMLGGKRMRPALLLLAAKACGNVNEAHYTLGAVIEMIHTATLVHDDVLDEADQRRHLATVNSRWNNETSVLLGDFLFSHAFYLATMLPTTCAARMIGRSTNVVCEGELRQIASRQAFETTEEEYLEIIDAKTAELCACACELGARYAEASDEQIAALEKFGRDLGIAFQIADDLLDVEGNEVETGKSLGTDLEKQKPTLPLIYALQYFQGDEREQVLAVVEGPAERRGEDLKPWLAQCDALGYARRRANEYVQSAIDALAVLPPSEARTTLEQLAAFVTARNC